MALIQPNMIRFTAEATTTGSHTHTALHSDFDACNVDSILFIWEGYSLHKPGGLSILYITLLNPGLSNIDWEGYSSKSLHVPWNPHAFVDGITTWRHPKLTGYSNVGPGRAASQQHQGNSTTSLAKQPKPGDQLMTRCSKTESRTLSHFFDLPGGAPKVSQ